jgi:hypothetical protein
METLDEARVRFLDSVYTRKMIEHGFVLKQYSVAADWSGGYHFDPEWVTREQMEREIEQDRLDRFRSKRQQRIEDSKRRWRGHPSERKKCHA